MLALYGGEDSYPIKGNQPRREVPLGYELAVFLVEGGCCHDYDDAWKCKLCGYQLPANIVERIKEPLKPRKDSQGEEDEEDEDEPEEEVGEE